MTVILWRLGIVFLMGCTTGCNAIVGEYPEWEGTDNAKETGNDAVKSSATDSDSDTDTDVDTDTDTDTDTDADADTDTDVDTDTDADTDTDTGSNLSNESTDSNTQTDSDTTVDPDTEGDTTEDTAIHSETDTGSDGDTGHDPDTDTGIGPECDGWADTENGLCWEEPYNELRMNFADAEEYCEKKDGGSGWTAPSLGQLRKLIRGCPETEYQPNYEGEVCGLIGHESSESADTLAYCDACLDKPGGGPSQGGCYWPAGLSDDVDCRTVGAGQTRRFWSSDGFYSYGSNKLWIVDFEQADITAADDGGGAYRVVLYIRCVKPLE